MKKILSYIFILILLIGGLTTPLTTSAQIAGQACITEAGTAGAFQEDSAGELICVAVPAVATPQASTAPTVGRCVTQDARPVLGVTTKEQCLSPNQWLVVDTSTGTATTTPGSTDNLNALESEVNNGCVTLTSGSVGGCLVAIFYYIFVGLGSFFLSVTARFLDLIIPLALSSSMYGDFIGDAWGIVRDISNIFFIIILLYVGIKIILGMTGHGTKETIAQVIVMALLINFSMFMGRVVIDTSNILGLIFYNQIDTRIVTDSGALVERNYISVLNPSKATEDKDVAGALYNKLNPTQLLTQEFFDTYRRTTAEFSLGLTNGLSAYGLGKAGAFIGSFFSPIGTAVGAGAGALIGYVWGSTTSAVPLPIMFSLVTITGIFLFAGAYAFFIAGWAFLGRLIELWILLIVSPFAFMSYAFAPLRKIEYLGWDSWISKLFKASFMAPIFMFFLYIIVLLIQANPFQSLAARDPEQMLWMEVILFLLIPSLLIIVLLLKAADLAKKGSGQVGEMAVSAGKALTGLAIGGGIAGTAMAGRAIFGRGATWLSKVPGDAATGRMSALDYGKKLKDWEMGDKKRGISWAQYKAANNVGDASVLAKLGARINKNQLITADVSHGRHDMDELNKKAGIEGVSETNISAVEEERRKGIFLKEKRGEIERDIKQGYDGKGKDVTFNYTDAGGNVHTYKGEAEFKQAQRREATIDVQNAAAPGDIDWSTGDLSDQGRKKVEDKLTNEFNKILQEAAKDIGGHRYDHLKEEATHRVGVASKISAVSTAGSYDLRRLPNLTTDSREGLGAKTAAGLIAAVAAGMRLGLKQGAGVEIGTPQKNFIKDIGNIVTESLKGIKIDISSVTKAAAAGSGHDDHGHGGGHH